MVFHIHVASSDLVNKVTASRNEFVKTESLIGSFMACLITVGHDRSEFGPTSALDRKSIKVAIINGITYLLQEWNVYWQMRKSTDEALRNIQDLDSPDGQRLLAKYKEVRIPEQVSTVSKFPDDVLELFLRYCQLFYLFGEYKMAKRNLLFYLDHVWYVPS